MPKTTVANKYVRFSDNPKMDNSGINVRQKMSMFIGHKMKEVTGPPVAGGQIREAALAAGISHGVTITDMASLNEIAALVAKGESVSMAANDVAREYAFEEHGRDGDSIMPRAY